MKIILFLLLLCCSKISLMDKNKEYEEVSLNINELILSAIQNNDLYLLNHYLTKIESINSFVVNRGTFLHISSELSNLSIVKSLLELGADPLIKNEYGKYAYELTNNKEVINLINDYVMRKEMLIAANNKDEDIINILLSKNKNILFLEVKNISLLEELCNILTWKENRETFALIIGLLKDQHDLIIYIKKRIIEKGIEGIKTREELNEYIDMIEEVRKIDKNYNAVKGYNKSYIREAISKGYVNEFNRLLDLEEKETVALAFILEFMNNNEFFMNIFLKNESKIIENFNKKINCESTLSIISRDKFSDIFKELYKYLNKEFNKIISEKSREKIFRNLIGRNLIEFTDPIKAMKPVLDFEELKMIVNFNLKNPINLGYIFVVCLYEEYDDILEKFVKEDIIIEDINFLNSYVIKGLVSNLIRKNKSDYLIKLLRSTKERFEDEDKIFEYAFNNFDSNLINLLINRVNKLKNEYLLQATENGDEEIFKLIIEERDIDINYKDQFGWTSLMIACKKGYINLVKLLLEKGVDVNKTNIEGLTAFSISLIYNNLEAAKILLQNSEINVNIKDNFNKISIIYAIEKDYFDIFYKILRKSYTKNEVNNIISEVLDLNLNPKYINVLLEFYLVKQKVYIKPNINTEGRSLRDIISDYDAKLLEPLIKKFFSDTDLKERDKKKLIDVLKVLKLKNEDFEDSNKKSMIKFIKDVIKLDSKKHQILSVCEIDGLIIEEIDDNRDVDLNIDVFISILSHFTEDDFDENVKEMFIERLKVIKKAVPIYQINEPSKFKNPSAKELENYENKMGEYRLNCIKFITKKKLHKLALIITLTSNSGKNYENIRFAMNIVLEGLVCHLGFLEAVNYALTFLLSQDYSNQEENELKNYLSNQIMQFRINLIEEIARKYLHNKNILVSDFGRAKAEYNIHMLAYLVADLSRELKVTGLYENEFRYEYDKKFVVSEVNRLYKERFMEYIVNLIREDAKLSNMIRSYLEEKIFKTSSYLKIEDFIHDDEYKIKDNIIKIILLYFGYLR